MRPTPFAWALLGVIAAIVFCLGLWACLVLLGIGYFITALVGVFIAYAVVLIAPSLHKE